MSVIIDRHSLIFPVEMSMEPVPVLSARSCRTLLAIIVCAQEAQALEPSFARQRPDYNRLWCWKKVVFALVSALH